MWPGARVTQSRQPRSRRSHDLRLAQPGARAAQAAGLAQPRPRDLGRVSLGLFLLLRLFFFFLLALISFSAGAVVLLYMGFKSSL